MLNRLYWSLFYIEFTLPHRSIWVDLFWSKVDYQQVLRPQFLPFILYQVCTWNQGQEFEKLGDTPPSKSRRRTSWDIIVSISSFLSWKGNIIFRTKVLNWYWNVYMKWFVKCNIHRTARSVRSMRKLWRNEEKLTMDIHPKSRPPKSGSN